MAYQTGTATDPNDLLTKLVAFLSGLGWTVNLSTASGTGWRAHLSKGGIFANLASTIGSSVNPWAIPGMYTPGVSSAALHLYAGTGYNGAGAWDAQAGGPIANGASYAVGVGMPLNQGGVASYHFFSDAADNIVVVAERTTGVFHHIGWGASLSNRAGVWTGGAYFFGSAAAYTIFSTPVGQPGFDISSWCPGAYHVLTSQCGGFVRADVDGFVGKWVSIGTPGMNPAYGFTGKAGASPVPGYATSYNAPTAIAALNFASHRLWSEMTNGVVLMPVRWWVQRDSGVGGGYSILGSLPNIFCADAVAHGVTPLTQFVLGADNYLLFPNFAVKKA